MAKSFVTTRGRKTVRWSTLPAEKEMLSNDLLLVGNNTTDYSDMLLLECVKSITNNKEKIKEMTFLFNNRTLEFRARSEKLLKTHNTKVEDEGFKKYIESIRRYIWRTLGYKASESINMVSEIFFGITYFALVDIGDRSELVMASEEEIRTKFLNLGVPESELIHLHAVMLRTSYWMADSKFRLTDTMRNEITASRLNWLNKYPLEEIVLLSRVAKALGRKELTLYPKLTIASNIVYGVPLSTLKNAHDKGELFETAPMEKILSYPRYYNQTDSLTQICKYLSKQSINKEKTL